MTTLRRLSFTALLATITVLPAWALHQAKLLKSLPAANETVPAPKSLALWFSEKPDPAASTLTLTAKDATVIPLGPVTEVTGEKNAIGAVVEGPLPPGSYTVTYSTPGADGVPVKGSFGFSVK